MKKIFAIALLLSFASVAFADGGGLPPTTKRPKAGTVLVADGGGLPPRGSTKPPQPGFAV